MSQAGLEPAFLASEAATDPRFKQQGHQDQQTMPIILVIFRGPK